MPDESLFAHLNLPPAYHTPEALLAYFRTRRTTLLSDQQSAEALRSLIDKEFPNLRPSITKAADAVMRHEFTFLGIQVQYGDDIPWHADP
jgi:hypothetical protein